MSLPRLEIFRRPRASAAAPPDSGARLSPLLARPSLPHRASFLALASEGNPELFSEGALSLGRQLERENHLEEAQVLYLMVDNDRARGRLNAMNGVGSVSPRLEFLGRRLAHDATDPAALLGMAAAGLVFRATRLSILCRGDSWLQSHRWLQVPAANLAGFLAEVPTFTAATRLGHAALGREQDWSSAALGHELASGAIVLGSLKLFSGAARALVRTPSSRLLPLANQGSMFLGIYTGHRLEEAVGLRPHLDNATTLTDSLATLIQFNAAGRLTHQVFGESVGRAERELDLQSERILRTPLPGRIGDALHGAALAPMWMMMGAGGIGGGGGGFRRPASRRGRGAEPRDPSVPPYLARIREFLDGMPELHTYSLEDIAFHIFENHARGEAMPFEVWLGRSLRAASPELVEFWMDYYFDPEFDMEGRAGHPLAWLRDHHIHGGLRRARSSMTSEDIETRLEALETLVHFLREGAEPELWEALASRHLEVKVRASDLLMRLGVNAPLPEARAMLAAERRDEARLVLRNLFVFPEEGAPSDLPRDIGMRVTDLSLSSSRILEGRTNQELIGLVEDRQTHLRLRSSALQILMERNAEEAVPHLRQALAGEKLLQRNLLEALDRIRPDWDQGHRHLGESLMQHIGREWLRRFPDASFSPALVSILRQLGVLPGGSGGLPPALGLLMAGGTGLATWLHADLAHAATRGVELIGDGGGGSLLAGLSVLLAGGIAAAGSIHHRPTVILERNRGGGGGAPPSAPVPRPLLGVFESVYDVNEVYPVARAEAGQAILVGRSTADRVGVFPPGLRSIARRHLELRLSDGRVEVRAHEAGRGVRINGHNLDPSQWYFLSDGDVVEFISQPRADIWVEQENPDHPGVRMQIPFRLGDSSLRSTQGVDQAPIFRFRRAPEPSAPEPPAPPPVPAEEPAQLRQRWIDVLGSYAKDLAVSLFGKGSGGRPSETPPSPPPPPPPPPVPPRPVESASFYREIQLFGSQVGGAVHLFGAGLRTEGGVLATPELLQSFVIAHRSFCGDPDGGRGAGEGVRVESAGQIRIPNWEGALPQRLHHLESVLERLSPEERASPQGQEAARALAQLRDRIGRLREIMGLYRPLFAGPEEQAIFDGIERAYHGLRVTPLPALTTVRSSTRSLDTVIRREEREAWIQAFLATRPPTTAVINMRILMGEKDTVLGRPVIGSFYRGLEGGTVYDRLGARTVYAFFNPENGEIVAFQDGSRATRQALRQMRQAGQQLVEVGLHVDAYHSGRILEVMGIPEGTRPSIRQGLDWLVGLQVLPAHESNPPPRREVSGITDRDPGRATEEWRVLLNPPATTDAHHLRRVLLLTPVRGTSPEGDWVLLTLEGYAPGSDPRSGAAAPDPGRTLQLWFRPEDLPPLETGEWVAVSRRA